MTGCQTEEAETSTLPENISQLLEQAPTDASMCQVAQWLNDQGNDAVFWRSLTNADRERLNGWVKSNVRVLTSSVIAGTACFGFALWTAVIFLSEGWDRDPIIALMLCMFFTWLMSLIMFALFFAPLNRLGFVAFGVSGATKILSLLEYTTDGEIEDFYKQVKHHPKACQYLYDVRQRRTFCRHDLTVAATLAA